MSNKVNDIDIKTEHTNFSMISSIYKKMVQITLKQIKSDARMFLFTILDM